MIQPLNQLSPFKRQQPQSQYGGVLIASVLIHGILLFGISFIMPTRAEHQPPSLPMQVTLISAPSEDEPDAPQALAQSNSIGEEEIIPQQLPMRVKISPPRPSERQQLLHVDKVPANSRVSPRTSPSDVQDSHLIDRDTLIQDIKAEQRRIEATPRERFVHANTKASELAPYLEKWRLLVERVGNMHYPEAARTANLEGELVLDVVIRADGTVAEITVLRSSGHWILDDSAEHIVRIAAPFEPFPNRLRRDYDILHIIRTWKFSQNTFEDVTHINH